MRASIRVVGMVAGGRQHIVAQASHGDPVLLKPEPDNPHDRRAIAVYTMPRRLLAGDVVSSVRQPPEGVIVPADRRTMMDRQAGYVPADTARQITVPRAGAVGWISTIRYAPPVDSFTPDGAAVTSSAPVPVGFDVACWVEHDTIDHDLDVMLDLNGLS